MGRRGYPEFRRKVLDLIEAGRPIAEVAKALGISDQSISTWRRQDRIDRGLEPGLSSAEKSELAVAKRRIALSGGRSTWTVPGALATWTAAAAGWRSARPGGRCCGRTAPPGHSRSALRALPMVATRARVAQRLVVSSVRSASRSPRRRGGRQVVLAERLLLSRQDR